jgi:hypothetical protein
MANLKLTNLATYKAYFEGIAALHKEIDAFKWGDAEVIKNDNRSDMPARVLWAVPYEQARYGDKLTDNVVKTKQARVSYLTVPVSNAFTDQLAAFDETEAVIEQIVAKIYLDKAGQLVTTGDPPEQVWSLIVTDIGSWTTSPVEMTIGSTKYIGCELRMNFGDNANLEYDAAKWN